MLDHLERRPEAVQKIDPITKVRILPEVYRFLDTVETARFGPITFASAPFGNKIDNDELLTYVKPEDQVICREIIEATGMNTRYIHDVSKPFSLVDTVELSAQIGAVLIDRVMEQKLWTTVDQVLVSSAFLPQSVARLAVERAGLDPTKVSIKNYRMLCAGAVAAFIDSLAAADADPTKKNFKTIILALEPLSTYLQPEFFTPEHIAIPGIFGNDFAAMGYTPDDIKLLAAQTFIKFDGGVIKLNKHYDVPPHNSSLLPPHYSINPGDENIISVSDDGVFLDVVKPEVDLSITMDGKGTGLFFGRESPPLIQDMILALPPEIHVSKAIIHQPSGPVVRKIYNKLTKVMGLTVPEMPFLLHRMQRSNSVSATTIVTWQYMVNHGMIREDDTIFLFAPGIGSAFCLATIELANKFPHRGDVYAR